MITGEVVFMDEHPFTESGGRPGELKKRDVLGRHHQVMSSHIYK